MVFLRLGSSDNNKPTRPPFFNNNPKIIFMEKFILQDHSHEQRRAIIEASHRTERITYTRNLTEAEIDNESKKLATEVKILASQEEEKKEVMRSYKERIDGTRARMEQISKTLLNGTVEVTEKCLKVLNVDSREVGFYNESGELVKVRGMVDDDLQLDMFEGQQAQQTNAPALAEHTAEAEAEEVHELPAHEDTEDAENPDYFEHFDND